MATRTLEMRFTTQFDRLVTIRVPNAREELTAGEVASVMDLLLDKNIFDGSAAMLAAKHSARVVTRSIDEIAIE